MKKCKFTESQVVVILKEADVGMMVKEFCRTYQISSPTYYSWKSKYGGMETSELKRVENTRKLETKTNVY